MSSSRRGCIAVQIVVRTGPCDGGAARDVLGLADASHVLDRHLDRQVEPFLLRSVDDGDGTVEPVGMASPVRSVIFYQRAGGLAFVELRRSSP